MNEVRQDELTDYFAQADAWSADRSRAELRSRKIAWYIAGAAAALALVEGFALLALIPLKRDIPYTILVDRQTGHVETLRPLEETRIAADTALTRSFLVQYVIARESFDASTLQADYRKVGLMSAGEVRERYVAQMQSSNPESPLARLGRRATIDVQVRSVSSLSPNTAMVRFDTVQIEQGAQPQLAQTWAAVIQYRYSNAGMSADDRLLNPLGFQVTRYRKDPETLPEPAPVAIGLPPDGGQR